MEDNREIRNEAAGSAAEDKYPASALTESSIETVSENSVSGNAEKEKVLVTVKTEDKSSWGDKIVTRKFMAIALAFTILVNAGVTAGVISLSGRHFGKNGFRGKADPGTEMFSEKKPGRNGNMTAPSGGPDGDGQMAPPQGAQGNSTQNNNEQSAPQTDDTNNSQDQSSADTGIVS